MLGVGLDTMVKIRSEWKEGGGYRHDVECLGENSLTEAS